MKEQRELQTLIDRLEAYIKAQAEQIAAQTEKINHFAAKIMQTQLSIRAALAALQTGKSLDVVAAIEILRGVK